MKRKKQIFFTAIILLLAGGAWAGLTLFSVNPERALPAMDEGKSFVVIGVKTPKVWSARLAQAEEMLKEWVPDGRVSEIAQKTERLFGLIEEGALMTYPGEDGTPHVIGAFTPDLKMLKKLDAGAAKSEDMRISAWDTGGRGKQGWTLDYSAMRLKVYLLQYKTFPKPLVLAALDPVDLDLAIAALRSGNARLKIKNNNPAPDYLIARIPAIGAKEEGTMATVNFAWVEDKKSAHLQLYTDMFTLRERGSESNNSGKGDLPLLGDGDLSLVFASDLAFLCELIFYDSPDPIRQALQYVSFFVGADEQKITEWTELVRHTRLSAVATLPREGEADPEKGAAYLVFESKKEGEKLHSIAKGFASRMAATEIKGWDWMHQMRSMGVLGGRGNIVLLGMGKPESFAVEASIPQELKEFAAPTDLLSFIALINEKTLGEFLVPFADWGSIPAEGIKKIAVSGGGSVHLRVKSRERADLGIFWKE